MIGFTAPLTQPMKIKGIRFFSGSRSVCISKEKARESTKPAVASQDVPESKVSENRKLGGVAFNGSNLHQTTTTESSSFSLKMSDSPFSDQTLVDKNFRVNDLNVQMLSKPMYQQLFGQEQKNAPTVPLERIVENLKKFGLPSMLQAERDVELKLPPLEGKDIVEHFYNIGEMQSGPYLLLIEKLVTSIPEMPSDWVLREGWTRYTKDSEPEFVDYPLEDAFVFDVEVCCKEGKAPTMATAVSNVAWYSWCSTHLVKSSSNLNQRYSTDDLIPLESALKTKANQAKSDEILSKPKLVVGHNVSYDRARVKEQYWMKQTGLRFFDTMSMHVSVSGVTSYQKSQLKSGSTQDEEWSKFSSLNSLSQVHKLYCGTEISKDKRDLFIEGSLAEIKENFQTLMNYCASDVRATHNILVQLLPLFMERFPHPVTLAGMLELGLAYLPINNNWNKYITDSHQTFDDLNIESKFLLSQRADEACHLLHDEMYKENLWLWDQDWSCKSLKFLKHPPKVKKSKDEVNSCREECDTAAKENEKNERKKDPAKIIEEETHGCDNFRKETILTNSEEIVHVLNDDADADYISDKRKLLNKKFTYLYETKDRLPKVIPHLAGYPNWYRDICPKPSTLDWAPGPQLIGTGMQIAPKLLSLKWRSLPVHYIRGHGWGQLVPQQIGVQVPNESIFPKGKLIQLCSNLPNTSLCDCRPIIMKSKENLHEDVQNNLMKYVCKSTKSSKKRNNKGIEDSNVECYRCRNSIGYGLGFIKLPHKNGNHLNVGNPLAKDYITKFSKSGLSAEGTAAERVIDISRMLSYWRNNRDRIEGQLAVWLNDRDIPRSMRSPCDDFGAIIPQVIVSGTLTRRAVERTWMTASNATDERVGSELRSMIQAPPGHHIVGADVDSQELWIASAIGDSYFAKEHGSTPFGWMTLSGRKSTGSDMHSITAKAIGISRHHAKIINYARIYGAGQHFAEHLLRQFNPGMSKSEARTKASKMFSLTKGQQMFPLKDNKLPEFKIRLFSKIDALSLSHTFNKKLQDLFDSPIWSGGSESAMFNCLEKIASQPKPKTPFLDCRLSRALEPQNELQDRFLPTRINWVVQSGAVDFLHLMLVCMRWLVDSNTRFCISFHDEVRYIVPSEQRYQVALALHVTNLLVRSFCIKKLGMIDVPQSVAFFSSVEVDTVLRKESNQDCITPSNPYGLSKGYNIPLGESLNVHDAITKAKSSVGTRKFVKKSNPN